MHDDAELKHVIRYLGEAYPPLTGLLLAEANQGNLQDYIENNRIIELSLRKKWCRQAAEAIDYIHAHGVIHSDLRPGNFLVHATSQHQKSYGCATLGALCVKS